MHSGPQSEFCLHVASFGHAEDGHRVLLKVKQLGRWWLQRLQIDAQGFSFFIEIKFYYQYGCLRHLFSSVPYRRESFR